LLPVVRHGDTHLVNRELIDWVEQRIRELLVGGRTPPTPRLVA